MNCNQASFSSFTKGLYPITGIADSDKEDVEISFQITEDLHQKIQKRSSKFSNSSYLSINGVCVQVSRIQTEKERNQQCQITVKVAQKIFSQSSLVHLKAGDVASLSMLSTNPAKWLLAGTPIGTVTYRKGAIVEGHTYLEKLTFECTEEQFRQLREVEYMGLNGSGLMVRDREEQDKHYFFSIYAGQDTRANTLFNKSILTPGTQCTLTLPYNLTK
jgi:hypothetical protein